MDKEYSSRGICTFFECYIGHVALSSRDLIRRECYVCVRRSHAARQYKGWYFVQPVVSMCADADRFQVRLFLKYVLSTFFFVFFSHLYIRECIKYSVVFFVVALVCIL